MVILKGERGKLVQAHFQPNSITLQNLLVGTLPFGIFFARNKQQATSLDCRLCCASSFICYFSLKI